MEETSANAGAINVADSDTGRIAVLEEQVNALKESHAALLHGHRKFTGDVVEKLGDFSRRLESMDQLRDEHFHPTAITDKPTNQKGNHGKEQTGREGQ